MQLLPPYKAHDLSPLSDANWVAQQIGNRAEPPAVVRAPTEARGGYAPGTSLGPRPFGTKMGPGSRENHSSFSPPTNPLKASRVPSTITTPAVTSSAPGAPASAAAKLALPYASVPTFSTPSRTRFSSSVSPSPSPSLAARAPGALGGPTAHPPAVDSRSNAVTPAERLPAWEGEGQEMEVGWI